MQSKFVVSGTDVTRHKFVHFGTKVRAFRNQSSCLSELSTGFKLENTVLSGIRNTTP